MDSLYISSTNSCWCGCRLCSAAEPASTATQGKYRVVSLAVKQSSCSVFDDSVSMIRTAGHNDLPWQRGQLATLAASEQAEDVCAAGATGQQRCTNVATLLRTSSALLMSAIAGLYCPLNRFSLAAPIRITQALEITQRYSKPGKVHHMQHAFRRPLASGSAGKSTRILRVLASVQLRVRVVKDGGLLCGCLAADDFQLVGVVEKLAHLVRGLSTVNPYHSEYSELFSSALQQALALPVRPRTAATPQTNLPPS